MSPAFLGSLPLRLKKIKGNNLSSSSFFAKLVLFAGELRELANGLQAHSYAALVTLKQIKTWEVGVHLKRARYFAPCKQNRREGLSTRTCEPRHPRRGPQVRAYKIKYYSS